MKSTPQIFPLWFRWLTHCRINGSNKQRKKTVNIVHYLLEKAWLEQKLQVINLVGISITVSILMSNVIGRYKSLRSKELVNMSALASIPVTTNHEDHTFNSILNIEIHLATWKNNEIINSPTEYNRHGFKPVFSLIQFNILQYLMNLNTNKKVRFRNKYKVAVNPIHEQNVVYVAKHAYKNYTWCNLTRDRLESWGNNKCVLTIRNSWLKVPFWLCEGATDSTCINWATRSPQSLKSSSR